MFALSDSQLRTIWNAADGLPAQKRGIFLERIVAWLQFRAVALSIAISTTRCA
jgi:hypothetical protein